MAGFRQSVLSLFPCSKIFLDCSDSRSTLIELDGRDRSTRRKRNQCNRKTAKHHHTHTIFCGLRDGTLSEDTLCQITTYRVSCQDVWPLVSSARHYSYTKNLRTYPVPLVLNVLVGGIEPACPLFCCISLFLGLCFLPLFDVVAQTGSLRPRI